MNEDKDKIIIIGGGPASIAAFHAIRETGKEVIIVDSPFANEPIPYKSFHVPEMLKPSEPNNRRTRRKKLRMKNKRK